MAFPSTSLTYDLGEHTLTIGTDGTIEIADTQIIIELTPDEAYKLLLTLQAMFS
jgi:hypothetical protein